MRRAPRRRSGTTVIAFGTALWTLAAAASVVAADPMTFGKGSASSKFSQFIDFQQPVTLGGTAQRIEVLVSTPGSVGPSVVPLAQSAPAGTTTLDYRIELAEGHIVPNTTFTVQFRVTDASGQTAVGPPIRHTYDDDRFTWKTLEGKVVRVHWIEGGQSFGQRALQIGDDAVAATADLLGVTESDPIDFFIYADQGSFYDALGPATRENVGGQAHPDIRTLFALITPAEIDASWVESVVPHELTHVVFATAVDNPYHEPPHWLNEGLAVYLSDGYADSDKRQVEQAAKDGSIIPLDGLAGAFPTTRDRFFLAYAESVSAVDRIVRTSGRSALVMLIRSYHDGVSDDEAFRAAIGTDVAGFEADWFKELGATPPTKRGPRPAPVGPLPAGWGGPQPDPSFEVVGSQPPTTPSAPVPGSRDDGLALWQLFGSISMIGLALVAVLLAFAVRRARNRRAALDPDGPGDNRLFGRSTLDDGADPQDLPGSRLWSASDWALPQEPPGSEAETGPGSAGAASPWSRPTDPQPDADPDTGTPVDDDALSDAPADGDIGSGPAGEDRPDPDR